MHIALLTDGLYPYVLGGMPRHAYHVAKNFLALGVKLTLVHCVAQKDTIPTEEEVRKVLEAPEGKLNVIGLKFPEHKRIPGHYVRESYAYSCHIFEALKNKWITFDFIYAKGFTAWCLLEHKKKGFHTAPVGLQFHGYEMYQRAPSLKSKLAQYVLRPPVVYNSRHANAVFSYGGEITDIIKKIGVNPDKIIEIGSGVEDSWIVDKPKSQEGLRKFVFVGRNERRKGIEEIMKCGDVFSETNSEMHWVGPITPMYKAKGSNHVFHGEVRGAAAVKEILDKCQVLIAPSHSEGMPNVVFEGMARGLAIISTKVGGLSSMTSNEIGRVVSPRKVSELKEAIRELALMPEEELMKLRKNSIRDINEKYTWSGTARETLKAIREVTFSHKSKREEVVITEKK